RGHQLSLARGPHRQTVLRPLSTRRRALRRITRHAAGGPPDAAPVRTPDPPDRGRDRTQSARSKLAPARRRKAAGERGRMNISKPVAEFGFAVALAVAVVGSGLGLIRAEHDARQRFVELEELN